MLAFVLICLFCVGVLFLLEQTEAAYLELPHQVGDRSRLRETDGNRLADGAEFAEFEPYGQVTTDVSGLGAADGAAGRVCSGSGSTGESCGVRFSSLERSCL